MCNSWKMPNGVFVDTGKELGDWLQFNGFGYRPEFLIDGPHAKCCLCASPLDEVALLLECSCDYDPDLDALVFTKSKTPPA